MANILIVVHRAVPYQGGSEVNCGRMAKEFKRQGNYVAILAAENLGDWEEISVTGDHNTIYSNFWDLVIIHGSMSSQDIALWNAEKIPAKTYYMLIRPEDSPVSIYGMQHCDFIGVGTSFDIAHAEKYGHQDKIRKFRYGIEPIEVTEDFRKKIGITTQCVLYSSGGWWRHKGHVELAEAFIAANTTNTTLIISGYDDRNGISKTIPRHKDIMMFDCPLQQDAYNMMAASDLYIMNSSEEGFGLVLIEALSLGVPFAARPVGGVPDLIHADVYGTMYGTTEALTDIIHTIDLMKLSHDDSALREKNKQYIEQNHMIEHMVKDISEGVWGT